jgi:nitrate/TMAO reductase-like tetraheme cytochrome c subunit
MASTAGDDSMADEVGSSRKRAIGWALVAGIVLGVLGIAATNAMVHWSGSNDFCSNACHSMQWAAEAYRRGPHYATHSGAVAGCADCHIPYHAGEPGALEYVSMLFYKAKAGTRDAIAQVRGVIDTKEKWEKARAHYSEGMKAWMAGNGSLTCQHCHDLSRMGGAKAQPPIVEMHAGLAKAGPVNCVQCHEAVGHVYEAAPKKPATSSMRDPAADRIALR